MTNLLVLVQELATDADARERFCAAPEEALSDLDDLTSEDVIECVDAVRDRVDDDARQRLVAATFDGPSRGETPRQRAVRYLLEVCAAMDREPAQHAERHADVIEIATRRHARDEPPEVDPEHPSHTAVLSAVPDDGAPDGSDDAERGDASAENGTWWRAAAPDLASPSATGDDGDVFRSLQEVALCAPLPEVGAEAGTPATVVSRIDGDDGVHYEIEVVDADGAPRIVTVGSGMLRAGD